MKQKTIANAVQVIKVLGDAGFGIEGDGLGAEKTLIPKDELEEERMAMQLNGLMAEFED